ncbi:hypothetical protein ACFL1Q_00405 [Patescibacteria group bacterium]
MNEELAQKAIKAALTSNWKEAVSINSKILSKNKKDIDSLNRIARAYAELGDISNAKKYTQKVLRIDPLNRIADKANEKWKAIKKGAFEPSATPPAESFLEESGKTKIAPLIYPGDTLTLAKLDSGDEVKINAHGHRVSVINNEGKYIGRLPDDIAARLKKLIKMGNKYQILVKSIEKSEVKVFIREVIRGKRAKEIPSFSSEKINYVSFTPPELVRKKEEHFVVNSEEEEG